MSRILSNGARHFDPKLLNELSGYCFDVSKKAFLECPEVQREEGLSEGFVPCADRFGCVPFQSIITGIVSLSNTVEKA